MLPFTRPPCRRRQIGGYLGRPQRHQMAALVGISTDLRTVPAAHIAFQLVNRRCFRPADDVQRHGLMGVAAKAFDFEIGEAGVEVVAQDRRGAGRAPGSPACADSMPDRQDGRLPYVPPQRAPPMPGPTRRRSSLAIWCPCPIKARRERSGNRPRCGTRTSPSRCRWRAGRPGFVIPPRPLPTNPTSKTRTSGFPESWRGEGERILASAVVRRFARNAAGEFELLIEGSTWPVATTV